MLLRDRILNALPIGEAFESAQAVADALVRQPSPKSNHMRRTISISLAVLMLASFTSHVSAQVKQGPTTRPVAQDKDKKATDQPRVTLHVVGMKKTKSGAT